MSESQRKVKFDGKHWIGKKTRSGPLRVHNYNYVAEKASQNLGNGAIITIPNARPNEYRFEEFCSLTDKTKTIEDRRAFYDSNYDIYFMKAQEINTQINKVPITFGCVKFAGDK